jgi:trimeric autotransporter adhesin
VKTLKRHLTVANVLSCTALFVALSASAYAAVKLKPNQVKAVNIAKQAVTNPKIKRQAVTSGKIKDGGVVNADLGAGAVSASKITNGAVTSKKLGKNSVTTNSIGLEQVTAGKIGPEAISAAKLSASLYAQLVRNVTYVSAESASNNVVSKTETVLCPTGKQAIGGGARVNGELTDVAVTGSNPFVAGTARTGWSAYGRDVDNAAGGNWSIEAFAVCAEL